MRPTRPRIMCSPGDVLNDEKVAVLDLPVLPQGIYADMPIFAAMSRAEYIGRRSALPGLHAQLCIADTQKRMCHNV